MLRLIKNLNNIWNKFKNDHKSFWDELEEQMVASDISINTTGKILAEVKKHVYSENINDIEKIKALLKEQIIEILKPNGGGGLKISPAPPTVFLIVGVNGTGKTTSVAKLASMFKGKGKKVLISAADTYRSAAVEQIQHYAKKLDLDIVYHQKFSDPGAVVYDSLEKAKARGIDLVVIDSTTGQNARNQAELFNNSLNLTGIILTKIDSTSRGGIVLTIKNDLGIPIKLFTDGEKLENIHYFDPARFTESIF